MTAPVPFPWQAAFRRRRRRVFPWLLLALAVMAVAVAFCARRAPRPAVSVFFLDVPGRGYCFFYATDRVRGPWHPLLVKNGHR